MNKFLTLADRQKFAEAQVKDYNFDWFSQRDSDVAKRMVVADTVYQLVSDQVNTTNPLPAIFEYQRGEAGKRIKAKRHYGGKVYERSYGEYKKASSFGVKFYTMSTSAKALHIEVPVEELKAGIITLPELAEQAAQAILYYKVSTVWKTLKTALPTSDTTVCTNVGTTLTQASLDTALRNMRDKYEIQGIFGRYSFLSQVVNYSGYGGSPRWPDETLMEMHKRGMIGQYMGVPIFTMSELRDEWYNTVAVDAANAFIIASKRDFNRYVEVTPLGRSEKIEPLDGTWHLIFDFEDGYALWETKYLHRLWNGV